jgi:hypothetical protein
MVPDVVFHANWDMEIGSQVKLKNVQNGVCNAGNVPITGPSPQNPSFPFYLRTYAVAGGERIGSINLTDG